MLENQLHGPPSLPMAESEESSGAKTATPGLALRLKEVGGELEHLQPCAIKYNSHGTRRLAVLNEIVLAKAIPLKLL